ncbi:MAG: carbonic anhydrase [Trebonia sp.]
METLVERNAEFAKTRFNPGLTMRPTLATLVICCADTRVDPTYLFGAEQGEIMALRNVGGRVTPGTLDELAALDKVSPAGLDSWELIVMQHTQCGIIRVQSHPDLLAAYFQVGEDELPSVFVDDPRAAVTRDVALLRADPRFQGARTSGLVYDVTTGLTETIVPN